MKPSSGRKRDAPRIRIGVLVPRDYGYAFNIMSGISQYAAREHLWPVVFEPGYHQRLDNHEWHFNGLIATIFNEPLGRHLREIGLPTINVSSSMNLPDFPLVEIDNEAAGQLAGEHLTERKLPHYACVGTRMHRFTEPRIRGFTRALKDRGINDPSVLLITSPRTYIEEIGKWIVTLPRPVGLMVCTDQWASWTLEACRIEGLSVPDEISMVSVDNDLISCQLNEPQLSSVDPDFEQVGYTAASLLHAWIAKGKVPPPLTMIPPRGVVVRNSSELVATQDEIVMQALKIIRERAPYGLTVTQLLDDMAISRRTLEYHFDESLKSTPAAEIRRVQFDRACQLLIDTDFSLNDVAKTSGLGYERQLRIVFQRELKTTPTAYRARFRPKHG